MTVPCWPLTACLKRKQHHRLWDEGEVHCLAWRLTSSTETLVTAEALVALHRAIASYVERLGARVLEICATQGLLCCGRQGGEGLTTADCALWLGQLICRWAAEQQPSIGLRVGIHKGRLQSTKLPGSECVGYFGPVVSIARRLAETCPVDTHVHLLSAVKDELRHFEGLYFSVWWNSSCRPPSEAYFLDPWAENRNEQPSDRSPCNDAHLSSNSPSSFGFSERLVVSSELSSDEAFAMYLAKHDVDPSRFGKGRAKTLSAFRSELQDERKSYLVENEGVLERHLELIHVSLYAMDSAGKDRELTISKEGADHECLGPRNRKLTRAVPEGCTWTAVVSAYFADKLQLAADLQQALLVQEAHWCKEERLLSPSVPGMPTSYVIHEVRMRVPDPRRKELEVLGLPQMEAFTTVSGRTQETTHWAWVQRNDDSSDADRLAHLLQQHGISIHEFGPGAFEDLLEEVYVARVSTLTVKRGQLLRNLQILKVWLSTDIMNVPHVLLTQAKVLRGRALTQASRGLRPISMRLQKGQQWQCAVASALSDRLGLDDRFQKENVILDRSSYRLTEEVELSPSFPGLKTVYRIHEVTCRILDTHPGLGLPDGTDFSISRTKCSMGSGIKDTVTTRFVWVPVKESMMCRNGALTSSEAQGEVSSTVVKRRVPVPIPVEPNPGDTAESRVAMLMRGKKTDWDRAWNAARRIRDEDYGCKEFFEDCSAAFPELVLYLASSPAGVTSGRSASDEYQRTFGALFAVFWLMRLHRDGARAFSFGIGDDWRTLSVSALRPQRDSMELRQRAFFLENTQWTLFEDVLVAAGLLNRGLAQGADECPHDAERTVAMLVLTAIHDIMKLSDLLPLVEEAHGPFNGYAVGEVVRDHDLALAYVLEHHPDWLPSFAGLPEAQQRSLKFTQSRMEYNMGWLVQAEAPPGALFQKFKAVITSGQASPRDVSFYFAHWLTDLAGAEPCPQEGCEKYVLKFPPKVLQSFLNSFPFVQQLSSKCETEVLEDYLEWRWKTHDPALGDAPTGSGSVACLRLVVMAQGHSDKVLRAFFELPLTDRLVLGQELLRTGIRGQGYRREPSVDDLGPAFLVYYAPALLQRNAATDAAGALEVLAEVLRQARVLWPLHPDSANETVTLRIDALKGLEVDALLEMQPGEFWALERSSGVDAVVKMISLVADTGRQAEINKESLRILRFGASRMQEPEPDALGAVEQLQTCGQATPDLGAGNPFACAE